MEGRERQLLRLRGELVIVALVRLQLQVRVANKTEESTLAGIKHQLTGAFHSPGTDS